MRPNSVSPWEIEPFGSSVLSGTSDPVVMNKRPRSSVEIPGHG